MLNFFKDRTKMKAFKQALKEVEQETASLSRAKQTKDTSITRTYQSEAKIEEVHGTYKIKNPLKRPETTAIDLKNFKDWRKVDKVDSKQPKYIDKPSPIVFKEPEEDDFENFEPKKTIPGGEFKKPEPEIEPLTSNEQVSTLDLAESIYGNKTGAKKDLSAETYLQEKERQNFKRKSLREMMSIVAPDSVKEYDKKQEEKKLTEQKLLEEQQKKQAETKIKVEVVDFEKPVKVISSKPIEKPIPKPEPKPEIKVEPKVEQKPAPKKATTRKPRGKSKKRYDADVISSVNWRKTKK